MLPEIDKLKKYRVKHDLSWQQLADEMREAGAVVGPATIHYHVQHPDATVFERTLYKIQKFLARVDRAEQRAAAAARAARDGHKRRRRAARTR